jgi:hypothetical protein
MRLAGKAAGQERYRYCNRSPTQMSMDRKDLGRDLGTGVFDRNTKVS